jgi:hypothetical protein
MRRVVRRIGQRAALVGSLVLAASAVASAQEPLFAPPTAVAFIPRYDWNMSAALLADPDPRFTWDTHWKGDFDLVTVPRGRGSFLIDYQALCGSEYRPFDPYQGNYVLEGAGSVFAGRTEIAGVFRHVSRHLSDRPKRGAVADNSVGPRILRRFGDERRSIDVRADVRKVIVESYEDYTWIEDVDVVARRRLNPRFSIYGRGAGKLIQVDESVAGRQQQEGGRVEVGVKVHGSGGALEVFGGGEQVIDAAPLDRTTRAWAFVGVRLLAR